MVTSCGIEDIDYYCEDILSGEIPSCEYTRLAIERFQSDLERVDTDPDFSYYFEPKAAQHFFDFVQGSLNLFSGQFAGKSVKLEPFQKFILGQLFGWLRSDKRIDDTAIRRFRELSLFVGKKNGKSMMGAFISLYFMLFEGNNSQVYNLATSMSHAKKLSFNSAQLLIKHSDVLEDMFRINRSIANLSIKCDQTDSSIQPIPSDSRKLDGFLPSCVMADETKDIIDHSALDTLTAGMTEAINPLLVNMTTAGYNTNSVGYEFYERDIEILKGELKDDTVLSIIYTIDPGDEENWDDLTVWKKANPLMDVSITEEYVQSRIKKAKNSVRIKNSILVKNLNTFGKSTNGWIDIAKWNKCEDRLLHIEDVADLPAIITIDLSAKLDLTNVKITFYSGSSIGDVVFYPFDFFYLPEARFDKSDDKKSEAYKDRLIEWEAEGEIIKCGKNSINYNMIKNKILSLFRKFNVTALSYDPWNSAALVNDLQDMGIGDDKFIEYSQAGYKNWDSPLRELEGLILDGRIYHNGNSVMSWCLENMAVKENTYESIRPEKISKDRKIDGAITLAMAVGSFIWTNNDEEEKKLSPIAERIMARNK